MSSTTQAKQPTIILHWLEASRSHRIAWLLEELGVEYTVKLYHREGGSRAPAELKKIFPLGKSPIVEIVYGDDRKNKVLAESGHIVNYLINKFDKDHKFIPKDDEEREDVDFYLQFAEGSLGPHMTYLAVHRVAITKAPFIIRPIISAFLGQVDSMYGKKEIITAANFLEEELAKQAKASTTDEIYFVGQQITGAEILLYFNIHILLESGRLENVTEKDFPYLAKWLKQMKNRPAFLSAMEKIKKLGNNEYKIDFS